MYIYVRDSMDSCTQCAHTHTHTQIHRHIRTHIRIHRSHSDIRHKRVCFRLVAGMVFCAYTIHTYPYVHTHKYLLISATSAELEWLLSFGCRYPGGGMPPCTQKIELSMTAARGSVSKTELTASHTARPVCMCVCVYVCMNV